MKRSTQITILLSLLASCGFCLMFAGGVMAKEGAMPSLQEDRVAQSTPSAEAGKAPVALAQIVDVRTGLKGDEVTIEVLASGDLQYTAFKLMDPLRLVLDFQKMTTSNVVSPIKVNSGVVQDIRALYFDDAKVQRLEIDLTSTAVYEIQKPDNNKLLIKLKSAKMKAAAPKPATKSTPAQAMQKPPLAESVPQKRSASSKNRRVDLGNKLSSDVCELLLQDKTQLVNVEFQEARLTNVFRFLSEFAQVNLVVPPTVAGATTVKVDSVPWNQVLDLILENHDLGRKCSKDIVRIGLKEDLQNERLTQPLVTQMVRLNYGDPDEVINNLDKLKTQYGKVVSDKRTNSIIVTDTETTVADMMEVVANLDQPTRQVQIEAKMLQMNRDFRQELGIQWGVDSTTFRNPQFPNGIQVGGGGVDFGNSLQSRANFLATPRISPGFIVDMATASTPFGAIASSIRSLDGDLTLDLQLSALESQGKTKTIASPKVTTLNNKEAKITSGSRLPFQTTDPAEGTKIEFIDAVIELKVTPQITSEEMVYLEVAAQQNTPGTANVQGIPIIVTKEAFTELLVADQDTAVLGGLFQKTATESDRGVPYVSEIPILGNLFKSKAETDNITELLILIKPTIVKDM